jgi:hypothetical protein
MSLKRKVSDESIEDQLYLLEEQEFDLLSRNFSFNDARIITRLREEQLQLYCLLYPLGVTPRDPTLYQLRLHSRNYLDNPSIRLNYLNQIIHYNKPKQSTFTFNATTQNETNNSNTQTQQEISREQLRELRLRHLSKSPFGKKMIHYYTKYKHKSRRESLIKLHKFFTKTIKNNE